MTITNATYASAVGCHFTMASRLRSGERKPGLATVIATIRAYDLTCDQVVDWLRAIELGAYYSGVWMRRNIFEPDGIEPEPEMQAS